MYIFINIFFTYFRNSFLLLKASRIIQVPFFYFVNIFNLFIYFVQFFYNLVKREKIDNMKELLPFSEVAKMYGVSESTFRRRLKKLDKKSIKELTKYVNGKVFIVVNKLSLYEKIENIEILPFNDEIDIKDSSESENLWKQNEKLLNTISEKDNEIRNLTSMVLKLQNDINGYIKQLGEGSREPGNNIADIILKTVLAIALLVLVWYLVFG